MAQNFMSRCHTPVSRFACLREYRLAADDQTISSALGRGSEIASDLFTTFHADTLGVERLLKWFMVVLLTLRADCSLVT